MKRYIVNKDGGISIVSIVGDDTDGSKLTKTLFELSRTTDMETHFDPAIHTRSVIAAGLVGHSALVLTAECEDTDLPIDRYFREAWEWEN
tara:strand:+ start:782 stop:1051 length:270 start_codon:yes stop_codon:yes gene_type:complete